jgi:hypothetical protein
MVMEIHHFTWAANGAIWIWSRVFSYHGAIQSARNKANKTPLDLASEKGRSDIADALRSPANV